MLSLHRVKEMYWLKSLNWIFKKAKHLEQQNRVENIGAFYQSFINRSMWFDHISWKYNIPGFNKGSGNSVQ